MDSIIRQFEINFEKFFDTNNREHLELVKPIIEQESYIEYSKSIEILREKFKLPLMADTIKVVMMVVAKKLLENKLQVV